MLRCENCGTMGVSRFCPNCGTALAPPLAPPIEPASTGVPPPPPPIPPRAQIPRATRIILLLIGGIFLVWIFARSIPDAPEEFRHHATASTRPSSGQVCYQVLGDGRASLTYHNESGGTEQNVVDLPWRLEFAGKGGQFLYLSAQKKNGDSNQIQSILTVGGEEKQRATSSTPYGIASVSGRVPLW